MTAFDASETSSMSPRKSGGAGLKLGIILAFLLSLAAFGAVAYLYQTLNMERREYAASEAERIQLRSRADSFDEEMKKIQNESAKFKEQVKSLTDERDELEKELSAKEVELSNLQKTMKVLETEPGAVTSTAQPVGATESAVAVQSAVPVSTVITEQQTDIIVGEPLPGTPANRPKIMTINRKFNFVVFNLGLQNDIKMGDKLNVVREDKSIGSVQVEKLYDRFAAATITQESAENLIKEGDFVEKSQS